MDIVHIGYLTMATNFFISFLIHSELRKQPFLSLLSSTVDDFFSS